MSLTRTHVLLDQEVTFEAGHRAWDAYEKHTGRSVLAATHLRELFTAGISTVHEFGWALSARWRAAHAPTWLYEGWLDVLPPVGSDSWDELHAKVSDLVGLAFYGKTWAELLQMLEELAVEAKRQAEKVISG